MEKTLFSAVYNRKKKLLSDGTALVQIEAYLRGKKKYFTTGIYLTPDQWDNDSDKLFLISFEEGSPAWDSSSYSSFQNYPSVQWKQLNIHKLKESKPQKLKEEVDKLKRLFGI